MILSKPSHEKHHAFSPYAASNCSNYAPPSISGLILHPLHIWATSRAISRLIARVRLPALGPAGDVLSRPLWKKVFEGRTSVEHSDLSTPLQTPPSTLPSLHRIKHNNTTSNSPFVSYPHYPTSTVNLISRLRPLPRYSPFRA